METHTRQSVSDDLCKYDPLAKNNSFVEVIEWVNGEGWDITLDDKVISLTYGELDAINYLINTLRFQK